MPPRVGVIGAMPVEIEILKANVTDAEEHKLNGALTVVTGKLAGTDVDVVYGSSNVGMVFAASLVTVMIEKFEAKAVVFSGVAGAVDDRLAIGDCVVGDWVINYDFNCVDFKLPWNPSYQHKRGEIPFINWCEFKSDPRLVELALKAPQPPPPVVVHRGGIATGSEFVVTERKKELKPVWEQVGSPLCVEMECAGVAQICKAYDDLPFLALRSISDTTTGDSSEDFNAFCKTAADNLWPVVKHVVQHAPSLWNDN